MRIADIDFQQAFRTEPYYVDDNYQPVISSRGYTYWRGGYTNKERFFAECHRYIDFSTEVIKDRARRMVEKIEMSALF